jgi:hypothetical protein
MPRLLETWLGFDLFQREERVLKPHRGARSHANALAVATQRITQATEEPSAARLHRPYALHASDNPACR